jgi:hypothetical protein
MHNVIVLVRRLWLMYLFIVIFQNNVRITLKAKDIRFSCPYLAVPSVSIHLQNFLIKLSVILGGEFMVAVIKDLQVKINPGEFLKPSQVRKG